MPMTYRSFDSIGAKPSRGLGDTVSKAIKVATRGKVKECGGCKQRRESLNRMVPYGRRR